MMELVLLRILMFALLGASLGYAYLSALGWNVRLYLGRGAAWIALLLHPIRLLAIGAAFTLFARQGALALLSSVIGFQAMRTAAINQQIQGLEKHL